MILTFITFEKLDSVSTFLIHFKNIKPLGPNPNQLAYAVSSTDLRGILSNSD